MYLLKKMIISTLLVINSIAIPIIQDYGCCIQYSYGSMMEPCCYKLTDVLDSSECINDTELLGTTIEYKPLSCNKLNITYI